MPREDRHPSPFRCQPAFPTFPLFRHQLHPQYGSSLVGAEQRHRTAKSERLSLELLVPTGASVGHTLEF